MAMVLPQKEQNNSMSDSRSSRLPLHLRIQPGNGKAESMVKSIKWLLVTGIQQLENQQEWVEMIPMFLLAIRTAMRFNSGRPPIDYATLGWRLTLPIDLMAGDTNVPTPDLLAVNRRKAFEWIRDATLKFIETYERQPTPEERRYFLPGEKVYIRKRPNMKWRLGELPFDGPFIVSKRIGPTTYTLERPDGTPNKFIPVPLRRLIPYFDIPKWKSIDEMVQQTIDRGVQIVINDNDEEKDETTPRGTNTALAFALASGSASLVQGGAGGVRTCASVRSTEISQKYPMTLYPI